MSSKRETIRLLEDDIIGLQCFEDNGLSSFSRYTTKVFPFENHPDSFYGYDYHHRLGFRFFDGVLSVYATERTHELGTVLQLPDWVEYDEKLYAVEIVEDEVYLFPSTIRIAKMPFFVKEISPSTFENCYNLQAIYLPPTVRYLGKYKVGGCTCCELRDMQGQLLNWELEKDWY